MFKRGHILTSIITISLLIGATGCAYRPPVQQGTILSNEDIHLVHRGMSRAQVEDRLGKPVLINPYYDNQLVYVYTLKPSHHKIQERQLLIYFKGGRVADYKVYSSPNLKAPL